MKRFVLTLFLFIVFFTATQSTEAKLLPRFKNAVGGSGRYSGVGISVRFRPDRLGILVSFSNLVTANNVGYTLTYQSNGIAQGVSGSLNESAGNYVTRELVFGTCSSGVCRYHEGLSDVKLEVVSSLKSGKQAIRRFRIKI